MDNDKVFVTEETKEFPDYRPQPKKSYNGKLILKFIFAFIVIGSISLASYLIGKRSGNTPPQNSSPNPTINTVVFEDEPTQTPNSTISGVLAKKISVSPGPTLASKTKIITSVGNLDGFRSSNVSGNSLLEIRVGRNNSAVTRGFVSFSLSEIPIGVDIIEARLRLNQIKLIGDPFKSGITVKIDHLTYGDSLDDADYGVPALTSGFNVLTSDKNLGWKSIEVTEQIKNDLANAHSLSQFRLHLQNENTGVTPDGDFIYFEAAEDASKSGNTPQLIVRYN